VEAFLDELQERAEAKGGPLVVKLARAPGMREQRWAHLLCGPVEAGEELPGAASPSSSRLDARVESLEREVARLRATVDDLCAQLGLSPPGHTE
jgi:uncharacterized protein YceH (UPF0502 family)